MSPTRPAAGSGVLARPAHPAAPAGSVAHQTRTLPARAARAAADAPWATYLVACVLTILLVAVLDGEETTAAWLPVALFALLGLASAAAVLHGVRRHHPALPRAWQLLAAAVLVSAASFTLLELSDGGPAQIDRGLFAGVSDLLHLAAYPLMMGALLLLIQRQDAGRNWPGVVDALVVVTGAALLSWVFVIGPLAQQPGLTLSERLTAVAYPVLDLLVLATAVRLAVSLGRTVRTPAAVLLGAALAVLLVSDSVHALDRLAGDRYGGLLECQGWMLWTAAVGAAALHPSMRQLSAPPAGRGEVKLSTWRLGLLAAASLTAPVALWVQWARGEPVSAPAFAIGSAVLFLLVLARTGGLAQELAVQSAARKRLLDRTVQAREEERVRVAADLHDGPIQRLASLGYMVEVVRLRIDREDADGSRKLLTSLREQLSGEVEALRQLMAELRPPVLDEWGLPAALSAYAAQFERHAGIRCTVEVKLRSRLDAAHETVLYRVAQEALTNVRKHSGANTAQITLATRDGRVELRITDDGVGFDVASIPDLLHRDHYGLAGMRQRVEMAGGTCDVLSRPGQGTTVTVTLPR